MLENYQNVASLGKDAWEMDDESKAPLAFEEGKNIPEMDAGNQRDTKEQEEKEKEESDDKAITILGSDDLYEVPVHPKTRRRQRRKECPACGKRFARNIHSKNRGGEMPCLECGSRLRWTREETQTMLTIIAHSPGIKVFMSSSSATNERYWRALQIDMLNEGYVRSTCQLRAKWKRLKIDFFNQGLRGATGEVRVKHRPPFYKEVTAIWIAAGKPPFGERKKPVVDVWETDNESNSTVGEPPLRRSCHWTAPTRQQPEAAPPTRPPLLIVGPEIVDTGRVAPLGGDVWETDSESRAQAVFEEGGRCPEVDEDAWNQEGTKKLERNQNEERVSCQHGDFCGTPGHLQSHDAQRRDRKTDCPACGKRWTREETQKLLSIIARSPCIKAFMSSSTATSEKYWRTLEEEMLAEGYARSTCQLRAKWKRLKIDFFNQGIKAATGQVRVKHPPPFYKEVTSIWIAAGKPRFGERKKPMADVWEIDHEGNSTNEEQPTRRPCHWSTPTVPQPDAAAPVGPPLLIRGPETVDSGEVAPLEGDMWETDSESRAQAVFEEDGQSPDRDEDAWNRDGTKKLEKNQNEERVSCQHGDFCGTPGHLQSQDAQRREERKECPECWKRWTREETQKLLSIITRSPCIKAFMSSSTATNEKYWRALEEEMLAEGYARATCQLRAKWKRLKIDFLNQGIKAATGQVRVKHPPPFYKEVTSIWIAAGKPRFGQHKKPVDMSETDNESNSTNGEAPRRPCQWAASTGQQSEAAPPAGPTVLNMDTGGVQTLGKRGGGRYLEEAEGHEEEDAMTPSSEGELQRIPSPSPPFHQEQAPSHPEPQDEFKEIKEEVEDPDFLVTESALGGPPLGHLEGPMELAPRSPAGLQASLAASVTSRSELVPNNHVQQWYISPKCSACSSVSGEIEKLRNDTEKLKTDTEKWKDEILEALHRIEQKMDAVLSAVVPPPPIHQHL